MFGWLLKLFRDEDVPTPAWCPRCKRSEGLTWRKAADGTWYIHEGSGPHHCRPKPSNRCTHCAAKVRWQLQSSGAWLPLNKDGSRHLCRQFERSRRAHPDEFDEE